MVDRRNSHAAMARPSLSSKCTSKTSSTTEDGSPAAEETFLESLKTQVDSGNIEEIIQMQKRALERFEKTNEMLATCCTLAERRLDRARRDFAAIGEQITQAKSDLEFIFRRVTTLKQQNVARRDGVNQNTAKD